MANNIQTCFACGFSLAVFLVGDKSLSDDSGNVGGENYCLVRGAPGQSQVKLLHPCLHFFIPSPF